MKYILFVDSNKVAEEIIQQVGNVEMTYNLENWIENYPSDVLPDVISIPHIEKLSQSGGAEYQAIIAFDADKIKGTNRHFYFRLSLLISKTLKRHGVDFLFFPKYSKFIRIKGNSFNPIIIPPASDFMNRTVATLGLIRETILTFPNEFKNKELDMWIAIFADDSLLSLQLADALDIPYVFSYFSTYSMKNRIIAIPDFDTCYNEEKFSDKSRTYSKCREAAATSWQYNKIFWRGTLQYSFSRRCLFELGKKYPKYLQIEDRTKGQFVPMTAQAKYKYLIDTRGVAWSSRLQTLLQLGRVVFIADRPFREWYFDRMIPMEHYVPVKEDMSDLIEKYFFMERNPGLYKKIVRNLAEFVEENLTPQKILFDTKELLLKYGVVKK